MQRHKVTEGPRIRLTIRRGGPTCPPENLNILTRPGLENRSYTKYSGGPCTQVALHIHAFPQTCPRAGLSRSEAETRAFRKPAPTWGGVSAAGAQRAGLVSEREREEWMRARKRMRASGGGAPCPCVVCFPLALRSQESEYRIPSQPFD